MDGNTFEQRKLAFHSLKNKLTVTLREDSDESNHDCNFRGTDEKFDAD